MNFRTTTLSITILSTWHCLVGQNSGAQYSIRSNSFAPLVGKATSQTYLNFSAVEPFGGLSVQNLPDFKNITGFIGQIKIAHLDQDGDGLSDAIELSLGTDMTNVDSDGDGLTDFEESKVGTNPLRMDTDGDGIPDGEEVSANTDPIKADNPVILNSGLPAILTHPPVINEKYVTAHAQIMDNGGTTISRVGFWVSKKILVHTVDPSTRIIDGKREGDQFTAQIDDLTPGMTYYIRAFAQNSKGMNYGSVRRIKIEGIYNAPFESSPVGGNWYLSEWFGLFMRGNANWIFHQELGWLYHEPANGDGMWVWNDRFKWTWSRKDIWPYMWVNRDGNWFYYFGVEGGNPTFWDYNSRAYIQWLDK